MGIPPSSHKEPTSIKRTNSANQRESTNHNLFQVDGRSKFKGKMAEARSYFRIVSSNGSVSNFLELDERPVPNRLRLTGRTTNDDSTIWYWDGPEKDVLRNKKSGGFLSGSGYLSGSMLVGDRRIAPK